MFDDSAARSLPNFRYRAINEDPTVRIVPNGAHPSFIEAALLYQDLRGQEGDAAEDVSDRLRQAGGRPLSAEDCCRHVRSTDQTAVQDTLAHFRDDLQIEIWDFSAAGAADSDFDIERLIRNFGSGDAEESSPVQPITVYTKAPWSGGPSGPPTAMRPPKDLPEPLGEPPSAGSIRFAVLDTGAPDDYDTVHPHLRHTVDHTDSDQDFPVYASGTELLIDAGHGLFILDIAYREASDLAPVYMPRVTRDDTGLTLSEIQIVHRLTKLVNEVVERDKRQLLVNMSFSGTTPGDSAPLGLGAKLRQLQDQELDVLVVAAAGNDSDASPHWPAAFATSHDNVVSVGALDATSGEIASFSNRGPWVEGWAVGTDIDGAYLPGVGDMPAPHPGDLFPISPNTEPWATWQGTSFAAPRVAAAIANQAAGMSSPPTLLEAWQALRQMNAGRHPIGLDPSNHIVTETGVIIV